MKLRISRDGKYKCLDMDIERNFQRRWSQISKYKYKKKNQTTYLQWC